MIPLQVRCRKTSSILGKQKCSTDEEKQTPVNMAEKNIFHTDF